MDTTLRWKLPLLFAGQAQKEVFHNEALGQVDVLLHGIAESAQAAMPPAAAQPGQCWIVASPAGDAWTGQGGNIAWLSEGGWRFITPCQGISLDVRDLGYRLTFDGEEWRADRQRPDGYYVGGQKVVGHRRPGIAAAAGGNVVDIEARTIIDSMLAALRTHGLIEE